MQAGSETPTAYWPNKLPDEPFADEHMFRTVLAEEHIPRRVSHIALNFATSEETVSGAGGGGDGDEDDHFDDGVNDAQDFSIATGLAGIGMMFLKAALPLPPLPKGAENILSKHDNERIQMLHRAGDYIKAAKMTLDEK
jgi:hypothetical protein